MISFFFRVKGKGGSYAEFRAKANVRNNPRNASRWLTLFGQWYNNRECALQLASFAFRFATWIFWG